MSFLIREYGALNDWNNGSRLITLEELLQRKLLAPIYVDSSALIDEIKGLMLLANQNVEVLPMAYLAPTDILCNAHYITVHSNGSR